MPHARQDVKILAEVFLDGVEHLFEQMIEVKLMACDLAERYGVGSVAVEFALVDIDARAVDAPLHALFPYAGLDDGAAYFPVIPIDVVRPFEREAVGISVKYLLDGQCFGLREQELPLHGHMFRMHHDGEEQVFARLAFPGVGAVATPGGLVVGPDDGHLLVFGRLIVAQATAGGVSFL